MKHRLTRWLLPALGLLTLLPLTPSPARAQVGGSYPPQFGISHYHNAMAPLDNTEYRGRNDVEAARIDCGFIWQTNNAGATKWFLDAAYWDGVYVVYVPKQEPSPGTWLTRPLTTNKVIVEGDLTKTYYSKGLEFRIPGPVGTYLSGTIKATWVYHYFYGPATARRRASGIKVSMPFTFRVYAPVVPTAPSMPSAAQPYVSQPAQAIPDYADYDNYNILDTSWTTTAETNTSGGSNTITSDVPWSGPEN